MGHRALTSSLQAREDTEKNPRLWAAALRGQAQQEGPWPHSPPAVSLKSQGPRQRKQGPRPHCTADRWPWWSLGGGSAEGLEEGSGDAGLRCPCREGSMWALLRQAISDNHRQRQPARHRCDDGPLASRSRGAFPCEQDKSLKICRGTSGTRLRGGERGRLHRPRRPRPALRERRPRALQLTPGLSQDRGHHGVTTATPDSNHTTSQGTASSAWSLGWEPFAGHTCP